MHFNIDQAREELTENLPQPNLQEESTQMSTGADDHVLSVLPENIVDLKCLEVCDNQMRSVNLSRYGRIASQMIFVSKLLK